MSKMSDDFDEDARSDNSDEEDVAVDKYHRQDRRPTKHHPIHDRLDTSLL